MPSLPDILQFYQTKSKKGWIDDIQFYVLFNSISDISGRWKVDNERLCAMEQRSFTYDSMNIQLYIHTIIRKALFRFDWKKVQTPVYQLT